MKKKFISVSVIHLVTNKSRKAAFASFNRDLNLKNVELISARIKTKGFRKGEEIRVVKAEDAVAEGVRNLRDINGNPITEKYEDYFLILDGQHRAYAVSLYNEWVLDQRYRNPDFEKEIIEVPAVEAELKDETATEYTNDINITKLEWNKENYVKSAAQIHPDIDLLEVYSRLIKTESNPNGFSLSTLNLIYCDGRSLSKNDFYLLCTGVLKKGKDCNIDIIPSHNIEDGDKFIEICRSKNFADVEIRKRYLIKQFRDISTSLGKTFAFEVLKGITPNDYSAMTLNHKLVEDQVSDHFKFMVERLQQSKTEARVKRQAKKEVEKPDTKQE